MKTEMLVEPCSGKAVTTGLEVNVLGSYLSHLAANLDSNILSLIVYSKGTLGSKLSTDSLRSLPIHPQKAYPDGSCASFATV